MCVPRGQWKKGLKDSPLQGTLPSKGFARQGKAKPGIDAQSYNRPPHTGVRVGLRLKQEDCCEFQASLS